MPKFFGHYGIPRIRSEFDNFVMLKRGQLFDHATRRWLEYDPDEVLCGKCQGSDSLKPLLKMKISVL